MRLGRSIGASARGAGPWGLRGLLGLLGLLFLLLAFLSAGASRAAAAEPIWRLEQPPPPEGVPFKVPLGEPGDLSFFSPSRGLLTVAGNDTVARGIFTWDGRSWKRLATVCGGPGETARIAWASATEFWVISVPSEPRAGSGLALCRFKDGEVVGSYSTRVDSADPFRKMFAAACNGPNDCWFGGIGSQDALGERIGAFHLRWDGTQLTSFYGPQGRGVTDLQWHGGEWFESTLVGVAPDNRDDPVQLAEPEAVPSLLHRIEPGPLFVNDPFVPAPISGVPDEGTELLALDSDGTDLWAVGGGAASGPAAPDEGPVERPPLAARLVDGAFAEVPLSGTTFSPTTRFVDIAAMPGSDAALAAAVPYQERASTNAKAIVARIEADGTTTTTRLPTSGSGRGSAARIACPALDQCWMVTRAGWLFHYSDGSELPQDTNPAFAQTIDYRPNESAEQFVPDTPPPDDSDLFKPNPPGEQPKPGKLPRLLKNVKSKLKGERLIVRFRVVRPARIQLVARRAGRIVGKSPMKKFEPGRGKLAIRVDPDRYPKQLDFKIKEQDQEEEGDGE